MMKPENRLRRARDIAVVFGRGQYAAIGPLAVKSLNRHADQGRAVVVVSKKVSKKAVVRNRIRRRLVETLAAEWATVSPGYDIVLTVREDVSKVSAAELKSQLVAVLSRGRLLVKT